MSETSSGSAASQTFSTGAVRGATIAGDEPGKFPLRFDLLLDNLEFMKRMARVFGEGGLKYPRGNWKNGFPETVLLNHSMGHLIAHLGGDRTEDHLAHAIWGLMTTMHQQVRPEKADLMDVTGTVPPDHNWDAISLPQVMKKLAEKAEQRAKEACAETPVTKAMEALDVARRISTRSLRSQKATMKELRKSDPALAPLVAAELKKLNKAK